MGLFGKLFKKKNKNEDVVIAPIEETAEYSESIERVDFMALSQEDKLEYIKSLEAEIDEIKSNSVQIKEEYKAVSAYLSDIQLIETMPTEEHDKLVRIAKNIHTLSIDRKIYQTTENKISNARYISMQHHEKEAKQAITDMKNNEIYLQTVNRDMKMLEAEKFGLREDAKMLSRRQNLVSQITLFAFLVLVTVFGIYLICGVVRPDKVNNVVFMVFMLFALALVTAAFSLSQKVKYEIKLTEAKLNKAITLHNKTKIKYVNTTEILEYMRLKFDVDNAYQLARLYELYLEAKREKELYMRTTGEMNDLMEKLIKMLKNLNLYDPYIWQNEIRSLVDKKEMVEVRHRLNTRRQKLREKLAANDERLSDIEINIKIYSAMLYD